MVKLIPAARRSAPPWITAAFIAVTWTSELHGSPQAQQPQGDQVGRRHAPTSPKVNFARTVGEYGFRMVQESSRLVRLAQATTSDQLQKGITRENHRPELLVPLQSVAIELQKSLQQERERAERLEQALAPAKCDLEMQTPLALKASDVSTRQKQAAESGAVELQKSLQQSRERAERLEQALAPAKRKFETQTAIVAKDSDESARLKQPAESGVELQKSLQQERERATHLQHDLQAAKREVETQTTLAAKANEEATHLKQAAESGPKLETSLQQERDLAAQLQQDVATAKRELGIQTALAAKANDEVIRLKQAAESGAELQMSLQREREGAAQLQQDLAAARREVETQTALAVKANEEANRLQQAAESATVELKSLQQERERAAHLQQDLATAKREFERQNALAAKANEEAGRLKQAAESGAKLQESRYQEQERAAQLQQDLAAAKREIETQTALATKANEEASRLKQAAESATVELKSLQQERGRATQLQQELAAAKRASETQTTLATKANEEASRLRQAAESVTIELKSLQQKRGRATQLQQDLAAAKREAETQTTLAAKANEEVSRLKQAAESATVELKSLQQERDRAAHLKQDLATAKRELERQSALALDLSMARTRSYAYQEAQSRKPGEPTAEPKPPAESGTIGLRKSLQGERKLAEQLERALVLVEHVKDSRPSSGTVVISQITHNELLEAQPRPAAAQVTVANAQADLQPYPADAVEVARLRARASVLLGQGDIGAARVVLERAADKGSAQAMFELAETYDPLILPRWRTYGTPGDATKARDLYAKAETGGIKEAKERSDALRQ
jgi:hypothetical protein